MYLNCHSVFSFRYGTLKVKDLLSLAKLNQVSALALTDINNTSASLNFIREAKEQGIKPVVGIDFRNGVKQQFVGLAKSNRGFQELNAYLSSFLCEGEIIPEFSQNLKEVFVVYPFCKYKNRFLNLNSNEYIGLRLDELRNLPLSVWKNHQENLVLMQPVSIKSKRDYNIHRLLRAIDNNVLLSCLDSEELCSIQDKMQDLKSMEQNLDVYPEIVKNTQYLLDSCQVDFEYKGNQKSGAVNHNKQKFTDSKAEDIALLRSECYKNLTYRYPKPEQQEEVKLRLEKELQLILQQGFESYFLINWDMLRYAREKGFFYVGRGSGANSVVAYLLRITDVDPIKLDLYFERFINPYRENPPDFDIDFSWKDRDVITNYLFEKYGKDGQIALLATYQTFSQKSLKRELGKVFGLPKKEVDDLSIEKSKQKQPDDLVSLIYKYAAYMDGIPSHLSIHAGGVIISEKPIHYYSATSMPPKGYPLVQFDMIHAEDVGLYKFDVLSQRGLGKIKDSVDLVVERRKEPDLDIHATERFFEDRKIKKLLREGNAIGCFYVESPGMRMLLKKLKAENYLGLVAASSIIRPGVAKSGMMREYILRSQSNNEDWKKTTPQVMQDLMEETYGVMVYQEDVIKVAHHFAGLSLGEADVLRRGMSGKFRSRAEFAKVKEKFFTNCETKGYSQELTAEVWRQTESFAGYAFSKGHSASYAVESYQSLYLKAHYPMEFIIGVINNGGGFYSVETYFHEARMMGANIHAPCVNRSEYLSVLHGEKEIYMGFGLVADLEIKVVIHFVKERLLNGDFKDLKDFIQRCRISTEQLSLLIRAGAFRFTGKTKQEVLWEVYQILGSTKKTQPEKNLFSLQARSFSLPELDEYKYENAFEEMELFGFPLCSPFDLLANQSYPKMLAKDMIPSLGKEIELVGYLVTVKKTKTSSGKLMVFGTFLDRDGDWIDSVHFPPVLAKYPFQGKGCYLLKGKIVQEFEYYTIEISQMSKLDYVNRDENHVPQKRRSRQPKKYV